ncbi:hypothetical protein DFH09DRAFT_1153525 [Mycena vulgaris]|nr:hypothetical protein DFH09DRAFT_1153525 [Mycena vulgaris]
MSWHTNLNLRSSPISTMFQPFESVTDFYPGLIVWCDPHCYEIDISMLAPGTPYDRKKSRELRPALVTSVNYNDQTFQAARLSASTPSDPSRWAKIDSPPPITWKLNDAWIWIAAPPTIAMVFNNAKIMHRKSALHEDVAGVQAQGNQRTGIFTTAPTPSPEPTSRTIGCTATPTSIGRRTVCPIDIHLIPTNSEDPAASIKHSTKRTYQQNSVSNSSPYCIQPPATAVVYANAQQEPPKNGYFKSSCYQPQAAAFNTLSPHPVVVPPGFTETRQSSPGWWRNPQTGWLWHASRGLLPPSPPN